MVPSLHHLLTALQGASAVFCVSNFGFVLDVLFAE
jgi:hypothetical protein